MLYLKLVRVPKNMAKIRLGTAFIIQGVSLDERLIATSVAKSFVLYEKVLVVQPRL